jgi:hypothetical protein
MADTNMNGLRQGDPTWEEAVSDFTTFPILTEAIGDGYRRSRPTQSAAPSAPGLTQVVESAFREVLGWRPDVNDPKGLTAALNQAFTSKEVDGHREWQWVPRSYHVISADMGAITGAQASIYTRAKSVLDQSLALLNGLKPLIEDVDDADVTATRSIVHSQLTELINELGVEGGPQVQRVDGIFLALLGKLPESNKPLDPEKVGGQLGILRERLGLRRDRINTIDEEQNFTNFLVLVDYVHSLRLSWGASRPYFDDGGSVQPFLGTQLVHISRLLAGISESVHEVYFAMDSVFIGPSDRQNLRLTFDAGTNKKTYKVAQLLDWVSRFASKDAPGLIQPSGKDGVEAILPTLKLLHELVGKSRIKPGQNQQQDPPVGQQDPKNVPAGYSTRRVQNTLDELKQQLKTTIEEAEKIKRFPNPVARTVIPKFSTKDADVPLSVIGDNFQEGAGAQVRLKRQDQQGKDDIVSDNIVLRNSREILAIFDLTN